MSYIIIVVSIDLDFREIIYHERFVSFQIVGKLMDADRRKAHYERLTTNLLSWIRKTTSELEKRDFPNSLEGIQKELLAFKQYRTIEKPPKYACISYHF